MYTFLKFLSPILYYIVHLTPFQVRSLIFIYSGIDDRFDISILCLLILRRLHVQVHDVNNLTGFS